MRGTIKTESNDGDDKEQAKKKLQMTFNDVSGTNFAPTTFHPHKI